MDTFRSKAIELKPAYQPFLSLIRKRISAPSRQEDGSYTKAVGTGSGWGALTPRTCRCYKFGTRQGGCNNDGCAEKFNFILVTYLVLLHLMIYRGPNGILSPSSSRLNPVLP